VLYKDIIQLVDNLAGQTAGAEQGMPPWKENLAKWIQQQEARTGSSIYSCFG